MYLELYLSTILAVDPLIYCGVALAISSVLVLVIRSKSDTLDHILPKPDRAEQITQFQPKVDASEPLPDLIKTQANQEAIEVPLEPIRNKLTKTRSGLLASLKGIFSSTAHISKENLEELRYMLVSGDIGIRTTDALIKELQESLSKNEQITEELLISRLKSLISSDLRDNSESVLETIEAGQFLSPRIIMVVGVNGVGKTTSTAKLAARLKSRGISVLLVAADTFRAAAVKQLQAWGERLDIPVVSGPQDCKPQTVVFDAMKVASENKYDVILIDTAGRLNTKTSLMQELTGVRNAVERHSTEGIHEVLLVVDGTTGQNAVSQAKEFHSAATLTGVIITKLDGSAKGGVVVAVKNEINVPIRYVGVGESALDLRPFNEQEFVEALLSGEDKELETPSAHGEARKRRRRAA